MRRLALILLCALSLSASARPFGGTTSGGSGETLLAYLEGAGASTYSLSGQGLDPYSNTPLDTLNFGTGTWGSSTASWSAGAVTVGAPNTATGLTPAIVAQNIVSGCGWGGTVNQACAGYLQGMYNSAPNDWLSQAEGAQTNNVLVAIALLPANPAAGGYTSCPFPDVLNNTTTTYSNLMSGLDAIATSLKSLTKPFILAPTGELNLGGSLAEGSFSWFGLNACSTGDPTSAQAAEVAQEIEQELVKDGVTNFIYTFETNTGVGNYGFGFPCEGNTGIGNSCATTVTNNFFDAVSLDSDPTYYDSSAYSFMQATGLPMGFGSSQTCDNNCGSGSYNNYSQGSGSCSTIQTGMGSECIAQEYPKFGYVIFWGQSGWYSSLNTLEGATDAMSTAPYISASSLPASFSKAGGYAGG